MLRSSKKTALVVVLLAGIGIAVFILTAHSFLAINRPAGFGILVIEGWIPSKSLDEVPKAVASGHYSTVIFVEYPYRPTFMEARLSNELRFSKALESFRIPLLHLKPESAALGKTYGGALAVKRWTRTQETVTAVDVFTVGVHARKSLFLYRTALGDNINVGVISGTPLSYNPKWWFISPRGIWLVARNLAAYSYSSVRVHASRIGL